MLMSLIPVQPVITTDLRLRLEQVQSQIALACQKASRQPEEVQLILVSKTIPVPILHEALHAGAIIFGENKAQELKHKAIELQDTAIRWHFIGHLQSNKIKDILPWVEMIHSVDNLSLAQKLNQRLHENNQKLGVLIQVNTSYEDSKSGVLPEETLELLKQVGELPSLQLQGLMTIGALSPDEHKVRDCFKRLRELSLQAQQLNLFATDTPELSMGMSGDFEWAIEEGSTMVRVGSAIFGTRQI